MAVDAWSIGIDLVLDDQILSGLGKVDDRFDKIQTAADAINQSLAKMGGLITTAAASASSLAGAFRSAATAAERIHRASSNMTPGGGNGGGGSIPLIIPGGGGRGPSYIPYTPQGGSNLPAIIPGQGSYGPGGAQPWGHVPFPGGGRGGNGPGPDSGPNGYAPNWTYPGQGGGGGDVPFDNGPVPLMPGGRGRGGGFTPMDAMSSVFIAQAATGFVADAVKGAVSPSFDVQDQLTNIKNMTPAGMDSTAVQKAAMAQAIKIQQSFPGMTIGQALAMISNLYSVDRNMGAVTAMAPGYAQAGYVMSKAQGGADANDELYSILRSSEDLGKLNLLNKDGSINTGKAMSFIDLYARLVANSNGNLSGAGALTMIGQAGPGATQMNDTALARMIIASQALGPSQVGTGINAMYQEFIGGKMSQATARALHDAGVLPDYMFGKDDKILKKYRYGVGQAMLPTGALKDEAGALADPIAWASKNLFGQYLNADGSVKTGDSKDVEGLIADLNKDFSRIPGMKLAGNAIFNSIVQSRQMANAASLFGLPQLAANDAATPNSKAAGVSAAFNASLITLAGPLLPNIVKGLQAFGGGLNNLNNSMIAHPDITGHIEQGIIAALTVGAGALTTVGINAAKARIPIFAGGEALDPAGGGFVALMALAIGEAIVKYSGSTAAGGPRASRQNLSPAGTPSDPLHVVVKGSAPSTPMPTGQTGYNQSTGMPMPGQPLTNR